MVAINVDAARELIKLADRNGITVRAAVSLLPEPPSEEVIKVAQYLDGQAMSNIMLRVRRLNARHDVQPVEVEVEQPVKFRKTPQRGQTVRAKILGYSVTAVIRWMGKNGWTFDDCALVLTEFGDACKISDITIRLQLKAGAEGQRGDPAPITPAQAKQLRRCCQ